MTSVKFGTSGLRGLVVDLVGEPTRVWTTAFLTYLGEAGMPPSEVLVGRDLRASSPGIARDCMAAIRAMGIEPVDCGAVPTPALALAALEREAPAIMVTGSHIPDDRNGLKFYSPKGEIAKADEAGIRAAAERMPRADLRTAEAAGQDAAPRRHDALFAYARRYVSFFGPEALKGLTIGVYQHSTVARDLLVSVLTACGADVRPLGRSDVFVPVDTEAHRPEDIAQINAWAEEAAFDAIVSSDGDADRPLIADAAGRILRGDVIGLLTARHLSIATIVTPTTSGSAIERSGIPERTIRTRVGSPFVIAGIETAIDEGSEPVAGFEANGGFLLGSPRVRSGRPLPRLVTRDAVLPIVSVLAEMAATGESLSGLVGALSAGHAAAHRLTDISPEQSQPFLERLSDDEDYRDRFFAPAGTVEAVDRVDGVRVALDGARSVHYRASGNAPELRCYVEADNADGAASLLAWGLETAGTALRETGRRTVTPKSR